MVAYLRAAPAPPAVVTARRPGVDGASRPGRRSGREGHRDGAPGATRAAARRSGAPPRRAPTAPSTASDDQRHDDGPRASRAASGRARIATRGIGGAERERRPPTTTRPGTGRAMRSSSMPSSSRAWTASASPAVSSSRHPARQLGPRPAGPVDRGRAPRARPRGRPPARAARGRGRRASASRWELTDTYSPAAIERRPGHEPRDARGGDRPHRGVRRRDAQHEARGRQDAVVRAEHRGAQPSAAVAEMALGVHHGARVPAGGRTAPLGYAAGVPARPVAVVEGALAGHHLARLRDVVDHPGRLPPRRPRALDAGPRHGARRPRDDVGDGDHPDRRRRHHGARPPRHGRADPPRRAS